jgi:hypothetical protein
MPLSCRSPETLRKLEQQTIPEARAAAAEKEEGAR